jgi:multiple sugar transport system permease protein
VRFLSTRHRRRRKRIKVNDILAYLFIAIAVLFFLFPIIWILGTSFKTAVDVHALPPTFVFKPTLDNYKTVLHRDDFPGMYKNSIVVAVGSTLIVMLLAYPAAYGFARYDFKRKSDIAFWMLSCSMIPPVAVSIPIFLMFKNLGLYDSSLGLIVMHAAMNLPLAVWLMMGYIKEIPYEIEESAMIDGCNRLQSILRIILPISLTGGLATAVLCFIFSWNEFLLALILTGRSSRTLPVAIYSFINFREILWGPLTASAVLVSLPVLVFSFLVRKYLISGLTFGAIKG